MADIDNDALVEQAATKRIGAALGDIRRSVAKIDAGNPYAAETDPDRVVRRLQVKKNINSREATNMRTMIDTLDHAPAITDEKQVAAVDGPPSPPVGGPEKIFGSVDFVNVAFLEKGARISRSVGRIARPNGAPQGTGFLIGGGLFITNNHVIATPEEAASYLIEFDYEVDLTGRPRAVTRHAIDTSTFISDSIDNLDFSIFAVGARLDGPGEIAAFGWTQLSDAGDKHMLGEYANIVQHPQGRFKEVVLRENRLVARDDIALHYIADTEPGSSGSPVYNSEWQAIALHHWGGPHKLAGKNVEINEGIRISAIVRMLRDRLPTLDAVSQGRLEAALNIGELCAASIAERVPASAAAPAAPAPDAPRVDADGRVTWVLPIEVSVRLPGLSPALLAASAPLAPPPATKSAPDSDYAGRVGYRPDFLPAQPLPLPALSPALQRDAARNRQAAAGADPFELRYTHFSIVMNGVRRLAFFTASNIDGAAAKDINRKTGAISPLRTDSPGLQEAIDAAEAEAAEASDTWFDDPRLAPGEFAGADIYASQIIAGFPSGMGRTARMFQRGHLVRRLDPAWGDETAARGGEADSFHYTNACPQVGFFNQGSAPATTPASGGGKLWRSVENYVLRNAVADAQRITCFTGPVFAAADRAFRGIKVPGSFWKIAVWVEGGKLRSLAMIADQTPVISVWPESIGSESVAAAEAFQDPGELLQVADFLSTIAEVEQLTSLDFGNAVRAADVRKGKSKHRVDSAGDLPVKPPRPPRRPRKGTK